MSPRKLPSNRSLRDKAWLLTGALLAAWFAGCSSSTEAPSAAAGSPAAGSAGTLAAGASGGPSASGGASGGGGVSALAGGGGVLPGSAGSLTSASGASGSAGLAGGTASSGGAGASGSNGVAGQGGSGGANAAGGNGGTNIGGGGRGGAGGSNTGGVSSGGAAGGSAALKAAMVVQTAGTPTAGDQVMVSRLSARGIQTKFLADTLATAAAVTGLDLVVISSSAESGPLGNKLRDIPIPVLCIENGEYPLMALTGTTLNTNYGQITAQSKVQIISGSVLVASLSGAVTVSNVAGDFGWGIPGAGALKGATVAGNANQFAVFGYEKGAQMVGMVAPARRAAFAIRETMAANLSTDGKALFDALLDWVLK